MYSYKDTMFLYFAVYPPSITSSLPVTNFDYGSDVVEFKYLRDIKVDL